MIDITQLCLLIVTICGSASMLVIAHSVLARVWQIGAHHKDNMAIWSRNADAREKEIALREREIALEEREFEEDEEL